MRGEHYFGAGASVSEMGSSPHARGAQTKTHPNAHSCGIIPACAGSTPTSPCGNHRGRDHPRMRGEHMCRCRDSMRVTGSSPHARGAPAP